MEHPCENFNGKQKQEFPQKEGKRRRDTDKTEGEIQKEYELTIKKQKIQRKMRREIANITDRYEKGLCKRSLEGWRKAITERQERKRVKGDEEEENERKKGEWDESKK